MSFQRRYYSQKPNPSLVNAILAAKSAYKPVEEKKDEFYLVKHEFSDFAILDQIKSNIIAKGYQTPTPIQDQAIPAILAGRDLIGIANTGTGKTAAFLIPLIDKVYRNRQEKVLIITPTRELALQIFEEFLCFQKGLNLKAVLCIGGGNIKGQKRDLYQPHSFVIGTPGRIKDLYRQNSLRLEDFNNVVLDEADRMVDIGFINDIRFFISKLPRVRQSLFFSATISHKVQGILFPFVHHAITVSVKQKEIRNNIAQDVIKVNNKHEKVEKLHDLLAQDVCSKVLIFGRTKWGVQKLTEELVRRGFAAGAIHGNKNQSQRQRTLEEFKKNRIKILLATDVASRGLDIDDVSHVINYDLPATFDDYIHRIGRTGRANKHGIALTFVE